MTKTEKTLGIIALVAVLVVGSYLPIGGQTTVERVIEKVSVGATPGSNFSGPDLTVGGVSNWYYSVPLKGSVASTTICTIKAPSVASSSLQYFGFSGNTGTGTAMALKVYKSTGAWPNTIVQIGTTMQLAANTQVATSSSAGQYVANGNAIFGPTDYLIVQATVAGGGAGTSSPNYGSCGASWLGL